MSSEDLGAMIGDDESDLGIPLKGLNISRRINKQSSEKSEQDITSSYAPASNPFDMGDDLGLQLGSSLQQPTAEHTYNGGASVNAPETNTTHFDYDDMFEIRYDSGNEPEYPDVTQEVQEVPSAASSGKDLKESDRREPEISVDTPPPIALKETEPDSPPPQTHTQPANVMLNDDDDALEIRYNSDPDPDFPDVGHVTNETVKPDSKNGDPDSDSDSGSDWDTVPAVASYDIYNDKGELQLTPYAGPDNKGGAAEDSNEVNGLDAKDSPNTFQYTKVAVEEQAQRSYKTNKKTDFLFEHKKLIKMKNKDATRSSLSLGASTDSLAKSKSGSQVNPFEDDDFYDEYEDEIEPADELNRDSQLNITKLLLNDMEKFAYLGAVNVIANQMCTELATMCLSIEIKSHKKLAHRLQFTQKDMAAWKMATLTRLYNHLDVTEEEIEMIEKLSVHKIEVKDLLVCLKTTQNIDNPWDEENKTSKEDLEENKADDKTDDINSIEKKAGIANIDMVSLATGETTGEVPHPDNSDGIVVTAEPTDVIKPDDVKNKNSLNVDVAWTVICDLFLVLLQNSSYDARSRTLLIRFAEALNISDLEICEFEKRVTDSLDMEQSTEDQTWDEKDIMKERRKKKRRKKMAYVGLAMVGGSLVLGLSGGLLAPVIGAGIAAGLTTVGITGATGFLTGVGGTTVVALSSTAIGANIGARGMNKRMGSVRTFEFKPLHNNRRVNLILSVSGWIMGNADDVRLPFSTVDPVEGDLYSLYWEPEMLASMGQTIGIVASEVFTQTLQQVLGATILTGLMTAIQWPMALSKLGYIIDNPWNVSLDRAWNAGLILADTLMSRNLGERPVTLMGFSLGAAVIHSCLVELCKKKALGLVENVFLFGTPVVRKKEELVMARSVVSGRFVSGYSSKDWVLAYLFRATAGGFKAIMGISPVEDVEGIENFDCTELVDGHMAYRQNMPKLLKKLGIAVLSEEFVEIEEAMDPDEAKRHRKLVRDVDAAQKKLLAKKKHSSWMPKWIKPKKSKWRAMMEEAVEDKEFSPDNTEVSSTTEPSEKPRKKDAAIVDHGALMYELQQLKAAMRKKEAEAAAEAASVAGSQGDTTASVTTSARESSNEGTDITETAVESKSRSLPQTPVNRSVNNFQLLSAGRTVLKEDDEEVTHRNKKNMTFEFPDDI